MVPKQPKKKLAKARYLDKLEIAGGGFSVIYKVYDRRLRREVAMKQFDEEIMYSEEIQRFLEEAQITAQLEHPNIVPVYDQGVNEDGVPYIILKLVKGVTLLDLLHEEDYFPGEEAELYRFLQIFIKVCEALSFAHSHGVIHRDLKPENIMVGDHGEVYLMDWGLVRLVNQALDKEASKSSNSLDLLRDPEKFELDVPGEAMGTFTYLPPEQAHGELDSIDERTDVFALGAILYEILTQAPLYTAYDNDELLEMAKACDIPSPQEIRPNSHLSRELCGIAMKALQKDPASRYQSVSEMQAEVELFLRGYGRLTNQFFPKGSLILKDGETGDEAYLLMSGRCLAYKMIDGVRQDLLEMNPGDVFGEVAAFSSRIRTANVEALDDVQVKVINKSVLDQEFGFGSWINRVFKSLASRFSDVAHENLLYRKALSDLELVQQVQIQLLLLGILEGDQLSGSMTDLVSQLQTSTPCRKSNILQAIQNYRAFHYDENLDVLSVSLSKLQKELAQTRLDSKE